ncbi:No apical meristem (NAM) protein [Corchorus olitorius]|uniref:No apical meristem (NAM) protein n=1 Tax=Corchorus olitorius TaxID=93759 RepID=A0A1R3HWH9_9ROSI|nr:No apical meristem (NAM) protein [Corchorus olitorius]
MSSLPPEFRFKPTEQEILKYYVRPAIDTGSLPSPNLITYCDLYTSEPWNLFDKKVADCFWIYTPLKKLKNENKESNISTFTQNKKENTERTARCGSWKGKNLNNIKDSEGKLLGHDRYYLYIPKEGLGLDGDKNHMWFMHKYTLPDEGLNFAAIYKVGYKHSPPSSGKLAPNNIIINNSALVACDTHKQKGNFCDDDHEQGTNPKKPRVEDASGSGASLDDNFASLDVDFEEFLQTVLTDPDETLILHPNSLVDDFAFLDVDLEEFLRTTFNPNETHFLECLLGPYD